MRRSISAEMHSGFMALRNECGMNLHRPVRAIALSADARANVARIQQIWVECRGRYGKSGPFLFGAFGAADAMFAPAGAPLSQLCDCRRARGEGLHGYDDVVAGVWGVDQRGSRRNPRHREVRKRVNFELPNVDAFALDGARRKRSEFAIASGNQQRVLAMGILDSHGKFTCLQSALGQLEGAVLPVGSAKYS